MVATNLSERSVLDYLLLRPTVTAQQVAQHFALPTSTAVNLLGRLTRKGLLGRGTAQVYGRGRPVLPYRVQFPGPVVSMLLEGSVAACAVFDECGTVQALTQTDLVRLESLPQAVRLCTELLTQTLAQTTIVHSDLAFAAMQLNAMRMRDRTLTSSVLPAFINEMPQRLVEALGMTTRFVPHSEAVSEFQTLREPLPECMVLLRAGDGVSCRPIMFGRIPVGQNDLAGELGHVMVDPQGPACGCGRTGCLEALVNGPGICRRIRAELESGRPSLLDVREFGAATVRPALERVWQAWQKGDGLARQVMDEALNHLARVLSMVVNLLDPDLIRVSGYVLRDRPAWIKELHKKVRPLIFRGDKRQLVIASAEASLPDQLRVAAVLALHEITMRAQSTSRKVTRKEPRK